MLVSKMKLAPSASARSKGRSGRQALAELVAPFARNPTRVPFLRPKCSFARRALPLQAGLSRVSSLFTFSLLLSGVPNSGHAAPPPNLPSGRHCRCLHYPDCATEFHTPSGRSVPHLDHILLAVTTFSAASLSSNSAPRAPFGGVIPARHAKTPCSQRAPKSSRLIRSRHTQKPSPRFCRTSDPSRMGRHPGDIKSRATRQRRYLPRSDSGSSNALTATFSAGKRSISKTTQTACFLLHRMERRIAASSSDSSAASCCDSSCSSRQLLAKNAARLRLDAPIVKGDSARPRFVVQGRVESRAFCPPTARPRFATIRRLNLSPHLPPTTCGTYL